MTMSTLIPKERPKLIRFIIGIPGGIKSLFVETFIMARFLILLFFVFLQYLINRPRIDKKTHQLITKRFFVMAIIGKAYGALYRLALKVLDSSKPQQMRSSDMILLAIKNLTSKKARTYVTVGGMAIGFGAVILLLSAGYGFERLVISQVANLSEMKQIDVNISKGSPLVFDSEAIATIRNTENVEKVIPIITSVSKIEYNNAVSDVIVYAVPSDYFKEASIKPLEGELFSDSTMNLTTQESEEVSQVKGVATGSQTTLVGRQSIGKEIGKVKYAINPTVWKGVYASPEIGSALLGYTKREPGKQDGFEVWGSGYENGSVSAIDVDGVAYNMWIKDSFPIWEQKICATTDPDCVDGVYVVKRDEGSQATGNGYITEDRVAVERYQIASGSALEIFNGKVIDSVVFEFDTEEETVLFFEPSASSIGIPLVNTTNRGTYTGELLYSECVDPSKGTCIKSTDDTYFGYWVKALVPLWNMGECTTICERYSASPLENSIETKASVYFPVSYITLTQALGTYFTSEESVLGTETEVPIDEGNFVDLETLIAGDETIDWATISSELGAVEKIEKDVKAFPANAQKQALVNTAMLTLLGISTSNALDEKFTATLIFDSKLFGRNNYIVESEPTEFTIKGVVSDSSTPTFFIPFGDVMVEGLNNVSTLKVISKSKEDVNEIRSTIESLGFQTSSVVDTVASISNFFDNLRVALLVLGMIALGVASLGMFNTLTVSLLEKTQEVGLLKTMGLKSNEVRSLFLAESMIMSVMGGVVGLLLGFVIGKVISLLISVLALTQGSGMLDITYIPFSLGFGLVSMSAIVGVITGWYPAERAKKISALNALRYE